MTTIEIFTDIGSTEDEIKHKQPRLPEVTIYQKISGWIEKYKLIDVPVMLILLIYLFDNSNNKSNGKLNKTNQSGGAGYMSQAMSPVSSTFTLVTSALGHFIRLITLIITIIMVPTIPILLYCLAAYYVIKRFLFMITTIK